VREFADHWQYLPPVVLKALDQSKLNINDDQSRRSRHPGTPFQRPPSARIAMSMPTIQTAPRGPTTATQADDEKDSWH
jgi:hypothetical protein